MKKPNKLLVSRKVDNTIRLNLSEVESSTSLHLKIQLQKDSLETIIGYFRYTTWAMLAFVVVMAAVEHIWPPVSADFRIVTDKVMITAVGSVALQSGAIIIAAFRGLFAK